jgi:hypothetical protein
MESYDISSQHASVANVSPSSPILVTLMMEAIPFFNFNPHCFCKMHQPKIHVIVVFCFQISRDILNSQTVLNTLSLVHMGILWLYWIRLWILFKFLGLFGYNSRTLAWSACRRMCAQITVTIILYELPMQCKVTPFMLFEKPFSLIFITDIEIFFCKFS